MPLPTKLRAVLLPALPGVLLVGFVAAVGVGAATGRQHGNSVLDGRPLSTFRDPTLRSLENGTWMSSTETWLDDHVPGRERWLELHSTLVREALRQEVIKDVYVGDPQGQLLQDLLPMRVRPSVATNAATLAREVHALGVPTMSVYLPRREEVFADRLPAAWPRSLEQSKAAFEQALSRFGPLLDLTDVMSDPARRDSYYWRTDHHWTGAGALTALDAITAKAATLGVDIPADTRAYATHTYGRYYGSLGRIVTAGGTPRPDRFAVPLPPTFRARLCRNGSCNEPTFVRANAADPARYANRYRAFAGGDVGYQRFENPSPAAHGTVLLIKDSFGDALSMYLAERVSTLVTIDERHYAGPDIRKIVAAQHPDLVILMHNQVSVLGNTLFDSRIWVDAAAAEAARRAKPGEAGDG
ncbi:MAG: DHHW family protein [Actinomycetales bacterium]